MLGLTEHSVPQPGCSSHQNNQPSREDAILDPAPVTTTFIFPTDTELNLFSGIQIFDKGHIGHHVFQATSMFLIPVTTRGHSALSQADFLLPGRKHRLVLTSLWGTFTPAVSDLRGHLLYLDI